MKIRRRSKQREAMLERAFLETSEDIWRASAKRANKAAAAKHMKKSAGR